MKNCLNRSSNPFTVEARISRLRPLLRKTRRVTLSAAAFIAIIVPAAVHAQSAAAPSPSATPTPADNGRRESVATAEDVIVTANKREENIQKVPSSISVINDVQLDNLHATQLSDYAAYVPGLQVNSLGGPGQVTISLRGLAPLSSGSTVATYIDEIPVGSSGIYQRATALELDLLPYDLQRIEILRGPQGTLYGANSIGGLVKYVTFEPSLSQDEVRFGAGVSWVENGDDPGWDVHVGGNAVLANNALGLRASYARNEIPGFIDNSNPLNRGSSVNDGFQQGVLASILWQPSEIFNLRFTAIGQKIHTDSNSFVALRPKGSDAFLGDLTDETFVDQPFNKRLGLVAATLNADLGFATLTSVTGYSNTLTSQTQDATFPYGQLPTLFGGPTDGIATFFLKLNIDKFTQELRLTSKPGNFLWQVGGFYTYERAYNSQVIIARQPDGTHYPTASGPLNLNFNTIADLALPSRYTEYAAYANASYKFTDSFKLSAGVRAGRNEQTFSQVVFEDTLPGLGLTPNSVSPGASQETTFDFMVSPEVRLAKDVLVYFRVATGYQPGGPNVALPGISPTVGSTTDISYELGLKSEFFDHKLLFNIAGYHVNLDDIQVGIVVNQNSGLANAGAATSNGIEFTIGFQPIKSLILGINGAYTDSTLDDDAPSLQGKAGDRLPFIPEFSGSFVADYYFPIGGGREEPAAVPGSGKDGKDGKGGTAPTATRSGGWTGHLGGALRYVSSSRAAVESNPAAYPLENYAALDLNADVSNGRYLFRVFARNVTDERAYTEKTAASSFTGGDVLGVSPHVIGSPIQPRTVGVEVDFRF